MGTLIRRRRAAPPRPDQTATGSPTHSREWGLIRPRPQPPRHGDLARGGGVRAGHTVGATDETGAKAVARVHHVTLLQPLGLNDARLTYLHAGRYKQLSQFGGSVIYELIA
jgi:hypothetical protein